MWLHCPWYPLRHRRWGFGCISTSRSATTATPTPTFYHIFHHIWNFLDPLHRNMCLALSPILLCYSLQRLHAATVLVGSLRTPRPPPTKPLHIDCRRTRLFSSALFRFDFLHGDLVRWLSGEYTNRSRNWTDTFTALRAPPRRGHPRQLPPTDCPRAQRITTEGVPPLTGHFESHPDEVTSRAEYDNSEILPPTSLT
jgi:hypothetical protein